MLWSILSALRLTSKRQTMPSKPYETLRAPHLSWDTETFHTLASSRVLQSKDPKKALAEDPPVLAIHYRKKEDTTEQHEFLINDLMDQGHPFRYALEHTVNLPSTTQPNDTTINQFLKHPASQKVLDAVLETVDSIPVPVLVGGAAVAIGAAVAASGPKTIFAAASVVVPLSSKSASSFLKPAPSSDLPLMKEGPSLSSSYLPRVSPAVVAPQYSLMEQTSMTIADVLQAMSNSRSGHLVSESSNKQALPADARSDDRFLGEDRFNHDAYNTATNLLTFHPKRLTLVHMAILAHVITTEHPLYALFQRQCYWFACTFFYAAQIIDRRLQNIDPDLDLDLDSVDLDNMFLPFHLFQAKLAGCWRGIRIHGIKLVLLHHIVKKFDEHLDKLTAEVEEKSKESAELNRNMLLLQHYQAQEEAASGSGPARLIKRNI